MKSLAGASFAFLVLAGTALAQTATPPSPLPDGRQDMHDGTGGTHAAQAQDDNQDNGSRQDRGPWPRHMMEGPLPPHPHTRAARFRIEAGDIAIGMTCPEDEPLKVCADFTIQLVEKLGALQKH